MISVIVPVYNTEKYLKQCIDSILAQTYRGFELVFVNDGSTDNSLQVLESYRDPRIRIINQENMGLSAARNKGLEVCNGEYVIFIDSDDYVHPLFLENMIGILRMSKADIVQCKLNLFSGDKKPIRVTSKPMRTTIYAPYAREIPPEPLNVKIDKKNIPYKTYTTQKEKFELFKSNPVEGVVQINKMFRKEVFRNIRYPLGLLHEDEYVIYDELHNANKIVTIDEPLYYYRVKREGSITSTVRYENILGILEAAEYRLEQLIRYNDNSGFYEFTLKTALNNFMFLYWKWENRNIYQKQILFRKARALYENNKSFCSRKDKLKYTLFFTCPMLTKQILMCKVALPHFNVRNW